MKISNQYLPNLLVEYRQETAEVISFTQWLEDRDIELIPAD